MCTRPVCVLVALGPTPERKTKKMDKLIAVWLVLANLIAFGVLHQRLTTMGYTVPLGDYLDQLYERFGVLHGAYPKCGFLNDTNTFIVTSRRVVFPDGEVRPAALTVRGGKIAAIADGPPLKTRHAVLDYGDAVLMPGVIDVHAHLNEPGRTDWEGIETGTAAAAAGGVTTVMDMPLNSDPVTVTAALVSLARLFCFLFVLQAPLLLIINNPTSHRCGKNWSCMHRKQKSTSAAGAASCRPTRAITPPCGRCSRPAPPASSRSCRRRASTTSPTSPLMTWLRRCTFCWPRACLTSCTPSSSATCLALGRCVFVLIVVRALCACHSQIKRKTPPQINEQKIPQKGRRAQVRDVRGDAAAQV